MAYRTLVEIHYDYYQFFANGFIALTFVYVARRFSLGFFSSPLGWPDLAFLLVGTAYFVTSRDNLRKYYTRVAMLLGTETCAARDPEKPLTKRKTRIQRLPQSPSSRTFQKTTAAAQSCAQSH